MTGILATLPLEVRSMIYEPILTSDYRLKAIPLPFRLLRKSDAAALENTTGDDTSSNSRYPLGISTNVC
jgi:hypothetical protein